MASQSSEDPDGGSSEPKLDLDGGSSEPKLDLDKLDLDGGSSEPQAKKRKISKLIEDMAQSITLLQEQEKSLKSNTPDLKGQKLLDMIASAGHLSTLIQKLQQKLQPATEENPFLVQPSSSESEFEGFYERFKIAVGNVNIKQTTEQSLTNFFGGTSIVSKVQILADKDDEESASALVTFYSASEAKKAVKKKGDILDNHYLYITPQMKDIAVFHFTGHNLDWTKDRIKRRLNLIFKPYGTIIHTIFPLNQSFGYMVTETKDGVDLEPLKDNVQKGIAFRTAFLKTRFCRAELRFLVPIFG